MYQHTSCETQKSLIQALYKIDIPHLFFDQNIRINSLHTPAEAYSVLVNDFENDFVGNTELIPEIDLQFFPEGGHLVSGLANIP